MREARFHRYMAKSPSSSNAASNEKKKKKGKEKTYVHKKRTFSNRIIYFYTCIRVIDYYFLSRLELGEFEYTIKYIYFTYIHINFTSLKSENFILNNFILNFILYKLHKFIY